MDLSEIPAGTFARHPWEVPRAQFFGAQLRGLVTVGRPLSVLDVGAGDGFLADLVSRELPAGSQVVCYDPLYSDAFMQRARETIGDRCSFTHERPTTRFDALLLLDVLEHVEHDRELLTDLVEHSLVSGGHALLSVPAHAELFTRHDISLGHYRRYSAQRLRKLALNAGLEVIRNNGLFHSLLPLRILQKGAELARGEHSVTAVNGPATGDTALSKWRGGALLTALVAGALRADTELSTTATSLGIALPGLSAWILARKP